MSIKKGSSRFETMTPMLRLLPAARARACELGLYLSSSMAFITRPRAALLTTALLFSTRETVAGETDARRATCSRVIAIRNPAQSSLTSTAVRSHCVVRNQRAGRRWKGPSWPAETLRRVLTNRRESCVPFFDPFCRTVLHPHRSRLYRNNRGAKALSLLRSLAEPFSVDGHELFIGASIGIAWAAPESTPESLERQAQLALSRAKQAGKARLVYFHSSMAATPPERLEMEKRLRFALARKEMLVYYQPQVDVFTGRVTGAEALLRWRPEGLGIVSPAAFVPILEETGQIVDFGRWVLGEACRQGREWIDKTGLRLRIGVNVSASQLALPGFVQDVQQPLLETGFPPELLELELTESAFVGDFAAASRTFRNLRTSAGVNFAVDDFGTGQSSLSYLHQLPFQRLKIDQSFIRGIGDGQEPEPLLETILRMAEGLGMSAIAEGVETPHQLKLLQRLRCPEAQGFLFAPPLPPRDFVEFCGKSSSAGLLSRDGDRPAPLAGPAVPVERRRA